MSGVSVFFTPKGIVFAEAGKATQIATTRLEKVFGTSDFSGFAIEVASNGAPILKTYNDLQFVKNLEQATAAVDWNAFARETFAQALEGLTGAWALPAGPENLAMMDELVANLFNQLYTKARAMSHEYLNCIELFDFIDEFERLSRIPLYHKNKIDPAVNTAFTNARNIAPLVLDFDLDNDLSDPLGHDAAAPVLFNLSGTDIKTATGWIKSDDAFYALDCKVNGNKNIAQKLFDLVQQQADLKLSSNIFLSEFSDHIILTENALTLADMKGAGQVRNLREAASLQTPEGNALAAVLSVFCSATNRSTQMVQLDGLLKSWAGTSSMDTSAAACAMAGVDLGLRFAGTAQGSTAWQAWVDKLGILERFNGQTFLPLPATGAKLEIDIYSTRASLLDAAYAALKESVYGALVMQTRLKPYLDAVTLHLDAGGIRLDFSAMEAANDLELSETA